MLSPSETSTCQSSSPKKIRRGYSKREAARLVADHYQNTSVSEPAEDNQNTSVSEPAAVEYEVDDPKPTITSIGCQVNKRPKQRSKYCQTNSKTTKASSQKPSVKTRTIATTIDEPLSSRMKDDQESDPSDQPLSLSSDDNDEQEISQPFVGNKPAGNLSISAGILFSGSVPSKALRMLKFMKISGISMSSYINHQKFYLYPSIGHVWHNYQNDNAYDIQQQQRSVTLGGDGRADTPGHSANFCSYTMLDLDEGVVVDIQLVQHHNIKIKTLVTDRHVQIKKWVRENMEDTKHAFDVWHVAKGSKVYEKLQDIINSRQMKKDIPMLSSGQQTSELEGFHSVVNPKMIGFSFHGMLSR
ncbi:unnamed protein product [Mytilus coruscus]|uniref:Uncharacterized protein n=1 Tax=Mytilus coruscus TaxID=42192 RepID=A0A6J8DXD9_MYTCO|nr:unnamed protein product [Mytilus coruscus]